MSYTVWRLVVCEKDPNDGFMSAMPWMIAAVLVPSSVETLTHSPQVTGFPHYPPESFICVLCLTSPSWQVFLGQEQLPLSSFIHIPCDFTVLLASTDFTAQIWNDCYCHHLLLFSSLHRTFVFFLFMQRQTGKAGTPNWALFISLGPIRATVPFSWLGEHLLLLAFWFAANFRKSWIQDR